MSFVNIERLTKSFHGTMVYQDVDLNIERGQICVLVGPSGCGKTTLLRTIAGLLAPDAGTIFVDEREISGLPPKDRSIGMVFQHYALFPNMTVRQNLAFGLCQQKLSRIQVERKVEEMIELMGLASRADARPAALSGGQKQRVALARALVLEPKLLLLDEPMSALDAQIRKRLREEVKRLQREVGFTAVLVTHDQEDALSMGDRIAVMQGGRFEQVGTPLEIYNRPANRSVATFIGDFNVMDPAMIAQVFARESHLSWAIHPEAIALNELDTAVDATSLSAEGLVSDMRVMGPVIRYGLMVKGVSLHAHDLNRPSGRPFSVGKRVRIVIAAEDIRELVG
jgi:putative spermidine/putrescine transport system ATP-binding protein